MLTILFENEDLVAIEKPTGISTIAERDREVESISSLICEQLGQKMFTVHRLDKGASGVLLFAKNAEAHAYLNGLFERREIQKTYIVVVHGKMAKNEGIIDKPIRQFGSGRMGVDNRNGKPCETSYKLQKSSKNFSFLMAYPKTGRRHQIRVHLYSEGYPIVGDTLYGDKEKQSRFNRLMLHSLEISFLLPNGEAVTITSPVPTAFDSLTRKMK